VLKARCLPEQTAHLAELCAGRGQIAREFRSAGADASGFTQALRDTLQRWRLEEQALPARSCGACGASRQQGSSLRCVQLQLADTPRALSGYSGPLAWAAAHVVAAALAAGKCGCAAGADLPGAASDNGALQ
jgi:Zn ribbon nucleic-acid-binding protein